MSKTLSGVVRIPKKKMLIIAGQLVRKIRNDAVKGIMQDGKRGLQYSTKSKKGRSQDTYKARKARGMRKLNPQLGKEPGEVRYFGLKGGHINTNTKFINLKLTGNMIRSLIENASQTTKEQIVLTYLGEGAKVLHNKKAGRNIQSLREKNLIFARDQISERHGKEIKDWAKKPINLTVG